MNREIFTDNLSIKKLDLEDQRDKWLIQELEKDELICGTNGYLWQDSYYYANTNYLQYEDIYDSPFSIYHYDRPIGYLEISKIYETIKKSYVYLSYALLKEERGFGYIKNILTNISNQILLDKVNNIGEVVLMIDTQNIASQKVAISSGFVCDFSGEENNQESLTYYKKRNHLPISQKREVIK